MPKESLPSDLPSPENEQGRQEDKHLQEIRDLNIKNEREGWMWLASRLAEHRAEAEERAYTDKLTGILNRRGFDAATQEMLSAKPPTPEAEQRKYPAPRYDSFSMLTIDIDRFKSINDTYGHDAGDRAIKELARFLKDSLREGDVLGRQGGDEFIVLFPNAPAEDIKRRFDGKTIEFDVAQGKEPPKKITITLSGGIKEFKPGEDFESAYKAADEALYEAKRRGRNGIVIAGERNG